MEAMFLLTRLSNQEKLTMNINLLLSHRVTCLFVVVSVLLSIGVFHADGRTTQYRVNGSYWDDDWNYRTFDYDVEIDTGFGNSAISEAELRRPVTKAPTAAALAAQLLLSRKSSPTRQFSAEIAAELKALRIELELQRIQRERAARAEQTRAAKQVLTDIKNLKEAERIEKGVAFYRQLSAVPNGPYKDQRKVLAAYYRLQDTNPKGAMNMALNTWSFVNVPLRGLIVNGRKTFHLPKCLEIRNAYLGAKKSIPLTLKAALSFYKPCPNCVVLKR